MLTEQQSEAIDYLIEGYNKTDVAKLTGVARQTLYKWQEQTEFKEEMQKRLNNIKRSAKNKIATKVESCLDNIYKIAMTSKDTRTKFQASKYICDQFLGSPSADKEIEKVDKTISIDIED